MSGSEAEEQTKLSEKERRLLSYIEQEWFLRGVYPTPETLCEKFTLTPRALNEIMSRDLVKQSLDARGIPERESRELTANQLTVINTMMNLSDTRSNRKKLADLGISAEKWHGWKQQPAVQQYMLNVSERQLGDSLPDAHMALLDRVNSGDISALKFYYEITGRYTGQNGGMDPRMLVNRIFDVIAKHVSDPLTLNNISTEFLTLLNLDQAGKVVSNKPPVAGELL